MSHFEYSLDPFFFIVTSDIEAQHFAEAIPDTELVIIPLKV
jgi:hypothetical protein